jgi:hypothetical protein
MLDAGAPNGGPQLISRLPLRLILFLVVGDLIALPAASASASLTNAAGSIGIPGAPTGVTATATDGQAEVTWSPPRIDGGLGISKYVVTSSPPGKAVVVGGAQTSALVNGLTNGERFTFSVSAVDSNGQGPRSSPSNAVTPQSLSTFTSTVAIRSVRLLYNGGPCVDQGSQCFGIQQNSFVQTAASGEYWIQNLVFVEDTVRHGWEAEGNYEIWNGSQQAIVACSGTITSGPNGEFCQWPMVWRPLRFPARISLTSTVADGDVNLANSLGSQFPAWSPGLNGVQYIVDLHEVGVPSLLTLYAPETVIVGETGRHLATFIGGSGSIASSMVLTNGQTQDPGTQCVAQSSDTSTGEASAGFYWSTATQGGMSLVDFATHGGAVGDGDGVKVLPGSQVCAGLQ